MSDPVRLLSGAATDAERELLGAWGSEQPSDAARARVLAMVGMGTGVVAAATAAAKAGAVASGSIAPKAGVASAAVLTKWIAIGALGVVAAGATAAYVRHERRASFRPSSVVAPASPASPSPLLEAASPPPASTTPAAPAAPPAARSLPSRHGGGSEKSPRVADPALGEQVAIVDGARRALAQGDASGALRDLDDYEARFPRGELVEEAEVLRVESLLAEGDRSSAARVGARFLAAHPESPHAGRVRALLGQPSP